VNARAPSIRNSQVWCHPCDERAARLRYSTSVLHSAYPRSRFTRLVEAVLLMYPVHQQHVIVAWSMHCVPHHAIHIDLLALAFSLVLVKVVNYCRSRRVLKGLWCTAIGPMSSPDDAGKRCRHLYEYTTHQTSTFRGYSLMRGR